MVDIIRTRILYMEDDPGLAQLLKKSLERRGFEVAIAPDGEQGLRMLGESAYDVLLVDYNMPFIGGIEVIRALKTRGSFPPTIMVTGQGSEETAVEALKLGASDYIVKDVEMRYLQLLPVVIDRVIVQQQMTRERLQMQEAIRESEERYRLLVELSPDGIVVHSDGSIIFINPAGARCLGGMDVEAFIGRAFQDFVHPDYKNVAGVRVRFPEGGPSTVTWSTQKFLRTDGAEFDVEVAGIPFMYQGRPAVQTIFRDITERKKVEERLEHMAMFDMLTGLPNRTLFFDRLNQLLNMARRNQYVLALLFMDLDRFKHINDTLGHEIGDLVLVEAGQRMKACTRSADTVARMGGDEFIGICGRIASPGDAAVVAEKIIRTLSEPFRIKGHVCQIGASIGISLFPQDGDDVEVLVSKADSAMYRVKERGSGGYQFFSDIKNTPSGA